VAQRDGEPWIDTPPAIQPGFLTVSAEHAQTPLATLAVNTDPRESDLRPVPEADLARWAQLLGLDVVNPDENLGAAIEERRVGRELWRPLLLAALACFVFESLLARRASAAMNAG